MRLMATDVTRSVCVFLCVGYMDVPYITEPIDRPIPFGEMILVDPINHVLTGVKIGRI